MTGCCIHIATLATGAAGGKDSTYLRSGKTTDPDRFRDVDIFGIAGFKHTVAHGEIDDHQRRVELEIFGFPNAVDDIFDEILSFFDWVIDDIVKGVKGSKKKRI